MTMSEIKQWVNLPKRSAYARAAEEKEDDLGERVIGIKMSGHDVLLTAKLTLPERHPYSPEEMGRNPEGFGRRTDADYVMSRTEGGGLVELHSYRLPAAGGLKFKLEARYKGQEKASSDTLVAWRMLFCTSYVVKGAHELDYAAALAEVASQLRKHFVELKDNGQVRRAAEMPVVTTDSQPLKLAPTPLLLNEVRDHLIRILWANYVADIVPVELRQLLLPDTKVAPELRACRLSGRLLILRLIESVDTELDPRAGHFAQEARLMFPGHDIAIQPKHITARHDGLALPDGMENRSLLLFDLRHSDYDPLFERLEKGKKALLYLRVRAVRFKGGMFRDGVATVATRMGWKPVTSPVRNLLHEIGHAMNMVANGKNLAPDSPKNFYEGRDGEGRHCGAGMKWKDEQWSGTPECVMFASQHFPHLVDDELSWVTSPPIFCGDCGPLVERMDLSAEGLKRSK
jgi:hypothetical protein